MVSAVKRPGWCSNIFVIASGAGTCRSLVLTRTRRPVGMRVRIAARSPGGHLDVGAAPSVHDRTRRSRGGVDHRPGSPRPRQTGHLLVLEPGKTRCPIACRHESSQGRGLQMRGGSGRPLTHDVSQVVHREPTVAEGWYPSRPGRVGRHGKHSNGTLHIPGIEISPATWRSASLRGCVACAAFEGLGMP